MLLNNQQITEEIKKGNQNMHRNKWKKKQKKNKRTTTTTQNLWHSVKAVLRGKFIAIQAYLKKEEKNEVNNLTLHLSY